MYFCFSWYSFSFFSFYVAVNFNLKYYTNSSIGDLKNNYKKCYFKGRICLGKKSLCEHRDKGKQNAN